MHHFWRWLGFSLCHQSSSPGVINQCPEDWLRTGGSWSGPKIITTCHPLPTPKRTPKTHCRWNHEYTPENTGIRRDVKRVCCHCERDRAAPCNGAQVGRSGPPLHTPSRRSAAYGSRCQGWVGPRSPGSPGLVRKQTHPGERLSARCSSHASTASLRYRT